MMKEIKKITEWLQPKFTKKDKKEKKERQERNEYESLEGEEMNIDMDSLKLNNYFCKK